MAVLVIVAVLWMVIITEVTGVKVGMVVVTGITVLVVVIIGLPGLVVDRAVPEMGAVTWSGG